MYSKLLQRVRALGQDCGRRAVAGHQAARICAPGPLLDEDLSPRLFPTRSGIPGAWEELYRANIQTTAVGAKQLTINDPL